MKETLPSVTLSQEVNIDYTSSVDGLYIEPEWVEAAVDFQAVDYGVTSAGFDIAVGGENESSLAIKKGIE